MATTTAPRPTVDVSPVAQLHLRERRISVEEYFAMDESGILGEDDRVELRHAPDWSLAQPRR